MSLVPFSGEIDPAGLPDPGPHTQTALLQLATQVQAIQAQLAKPGTASNTFPAKIKQPFSKAVPYNEHQWIDEAGNVRGQILVHGWDSETPQQFHGHMSFYVWDTSDPSGNNRHHPLNIYWATRYQADPANDPRLRSRIAWDHSYFDLMDSVLVMGNHEVYVDPTGALKTRPKTLIPAPTPTT